MEPIIEAESFLEASVVKSITIGSEKVFAIRKSIMSTKFVYTEGAKTFEVEVDEND